MISVHAVTKPTGMPKGVNPQEWRQAIEARVDELLDQSFALIAALDMMEIDPDFEANGDDEYTLAGADSDRELDNSDYEPGGDDERDDHFDTIQWALDPLISQDGPAFHGR